MRHPQVSSHVPAGTAGHAYGGDRGLPLPASASVRGTAVSGFKARCLRHHTHSSFFTSAHRSLPSVFQSNSSCTEILPVLVNIIYLSATVVDWKYYVKLRIEKYTGLTQRSSLRTTTRITAYYLPHCHYVNTHHHCMPSKPPKPSCYDVLHDRSIYFHSQMVSDS